MITISNLVLLKIINDFITKIYLNKSDLDFSIVSWNTVKSLKHCKENRSKLSNFATFVLTGKSIPAFSLSLCHCLLPAEMKQKLAPAARWRMYQSAIYLLISWVRNRVQMTHPDSRLNLVLSSGKPSWLLPLYSSGIKRIIILYHSSQISVFPASLQIVILLMAEMRPFLLLQYLPHTSQAPSSVICWEDG